MSRVHELPIGTKCEGCGRPATHITRDDVELCAECYYTTPAESQSLPEITAAHVDFTVRLHRYLEFASELAEGWGDGGREGEAITKDIATVLRSLVDKSHVLVERREIAKLALSLHCVANAIDDASYAVAVNAVAGKLDDWLGDKEGTR